MDGPLKILDQCLVNSPGKPGALHSISYKDGKLTVSTEVEPTPTVEQIIWCERPDSHSSYVEPYEFSMPDKEVDIAGEKNESRTITVVSRGETVAVYEFLPGADLSDFDASGDLKWPAPEEHLKLAGWQWNREGSDRWMEKPSVMPEENLVVTSLWWPEEYSVTCNGEKTWVPFGHDLYPPAVETPVGMIFDHWEWTVEGSTAVIDKPYTMPACNLIATPFWTPRAYCLTVNGAATQVLYGTALAEPAAPAAPEGHSFGGWKWTVGGAEASKPATMPACDVTAEPIWTANTYTLTVNGAATQVLYDTALAEPAAPAAPEGHSFGGWKWTVGGAEASKPATMPACDVTAEPIWTANTYTLTVNGAATQVLYDTALAEPAAPAAPEGHSFGGWKWTVGGAEASKPDTMPACDVTAEPIWTRNAYTLTFIGNEDGTVLLSQTCYYGDTIPYPANPTREGKEFTGWSFTGATMPAHDLTITANWKDATPPTPEEPEKPTKYPVTFTMNGEQVPEWTTQHYAAGETIVPPSLPVGWAWKWEGSWVMPEDALTIDAVRVER